MIKDKWADEVVSRIVKYDNSFSGYMVCYLVISTESKQFMDCLKSNKIINCYDTSHTDTFYTSEPIQNWRETLRKILLLEELSLKYILKFMAYSSIDFNDKINELINMRDSPTLDDDLLMWKLEN